MSFWNPKNKPTLYRLLEIFPGFASLAVLILLVILSFFIPVWIAIFVILYDLYWLIKAFYLSYFLLKGYKSMKRNLKISWIPKIEEKHGKYWENVYHLIIFPFVHEVEVVDSTFQTLSKSNYPLDKLIVVLACEERAWDAAEQKAMDVQKKYANNFFKLLITKHPKDIPGEIKGKGSNVTWAGKKAKKIIDEMKIPYENVIVSVLDIDTQVHPEYFGRLTYEYLSQDNPTRCSYQPIPVFHNNVWDAPAIMRVVATSTSFWQLMEQGRPERLVTFSSHSMSFQAVVDIGFWCTSAVSEDSRVFYQCLLRYNGDYKTVPLYFPISMDACLADTYWKSLVNQYKQQRRWAWGTENLPFAIYNFIQSKTMPLWTKLEHSFWLIDGAISWATGALIIAVVGWLPLLVGGNKFNDTVFAQSLPIVTRTLMTFAMVGLILSTFISLLTLPKRPRKYTFSRSIAMFFQWGLLPISTVFFGSVPAIDSQLRLMLGKYMGFWVTEKTRKDGKENSLPGKVLRYGNRETLAK